VEREPRASRSGRNRNTVSIIGAGLGGLTAGNLPAQRGHRVTMFESHLRRRGYVRGF